MSVFRVEKTDNYTVMSNYHLRDRSISLKTKGLLSQMLSLPPEWDYTLQGLAYINKEGINSVREGVKELEKAGYIKRRRVRGDKGLFAGNEYVIRELPESEKPSYENRTLENPTYDNETQIKKEKENIDCINHRIISYQPENDTSEVTEKDIEMLEDIMWNELGTKQDYEAEYGEKPLGEFVREIVGLDMNAAKEAFADYLNDAALDSRQLYFVNQIIEYTVHNGLMKDLSVLQESPFTDQGSIVDVFTDLSLWAGIRKTIDSVNANARTS